MNAGEINIAVTASMAQFNQTMVAVKQSAAETATGTGALIRDRLRNEFSEQKAGKILGTVLGVGMADNLLRSVSSAIRGDKSIGQTLNDLITNIPIIGSAFELGKAIGQKIADGISGESQAEIEEAIAQRAGARESILAGVSRAQQMEREEQAAQAALMLDNRRLELEMQVATVRKTGSQEGIVRAEYEKSLSEEILRFELERAKTTDKRTEELLQQQHDRRLFLLKIERDTQLKQLADVAAQKAADAKKEADRAAENAKKESEDRMKRDRERMRDMVEAWRKSQEAMKEAESKAQAERREAQTAGIGELQTALGAFKFDAYPATAKKANDERIVRALETMKDKIGSGGFI